MRNAFIIHGAYGSPDENWIPWLKSELENLGLSVHVPTFPTPEDQTLEHWKAVLSEHLDLLDKDSILIGHSIGVGFLLHILEETEVSSVFFVSPFSSQLGNPDFDTINASFLEYEFDWERIKKHSHHFSVFHGDNDPYVSIEKAKEVTAHLGVPLNLVQGGGHFNSAAGYDRFNLLLNEIKESIK